MGRCWAELGLTGMRRQVLSAYVCDICAVWLAWVGELWPAVEHTRVRSVNAPRSQAGWRWALQGWWVSCLSSLGVAAFAAFAAVADRPWAVAAAVSEGARSCGRNCSKRRPGSALTPRARVYVAECSGQR